MHMIKVLFVADTSRHDTKEKLMLAATQRTYGAPDVLTLEHVEAPTPGPHDVLVRVHASPVTQGDRRLRASDFPTLSWLPGRLMFGLTRPRDPVKGTQFAGRVVAVGDQVTRFAVGDDVFGGADKGAYAELLVVSEDAAVARMPEGWGYAEAASMPYGAITAIVFLGRMAGLSAGEHVAIVGASGGVGRMAVQVAKALGAEVTAVASRDHALMRELGADHVVDRRAEDFTAHRGRYDVVFDTSGHVPFARSRGALTARGRYVSLFMTARGLFEMAWTRALGGQRTLCGVALADRELVEELAALMADGAMRAVVAHRYPLERIVEAHERLEAGGLTGAVVVEPAPGDVVPMAISRAA
jgi:NADPH:quinone reductase-like Zn-dependent oxidoreductase